MFTDDQKRFEIFMRLPSLIYSSYIDEDAYDFLISHWEIMHNLSLHKSRGIYCTTFQLTDVARQ